MNADNKQALSIKHAASSASKNAYQVTGSFIKSSFEEKQPVWLRKVIMLKARCLRLAGQTTVIGSTVFSFDVSGVCSVENLGNAKVDFDILLQQNGVLPFEEEVKPVLPVVEQDVITPPVPKMMAKHTVIEDTNDADDDKSDKTDKKKKTTK